MQTIRRRGAANGSHRLPAAAILAAGIGLVLGCAASTPTIDGAKLEQKLRDDFAKSSTPVTAVDCPQDRPARQGDSFSCHVTLGSGGVVQYDVVLTDSAGHYTYVVGPGQVVDGKAAAGLLTADIAASTTDLAAASVACPASVLAPGGHAQFDCQLLVAGAPVTIAVTAAPGVPLTWQFKA